MKHIIVACASGVNTSGMVAAKINTLLEERGYSGKAVANSTNFYSLENLVKSGAADIFVTIAPNSQLKLPIPTFSGIPFLTNVGVNAAIDQIIALL